MVTDLLSWKLEVFSFTNERGAKRRNSLFITDIGIPVYPAGRATFTLPRWKRVFSWGEWRCKEGNLSAVDVGNWRPAWKGRERKEVRWCVCLWRERTELRCKCCDCVSGECGWSVGRIGEGERRCKWSKPGYLCVVVGGNYALLLWRQRVIRSICTMCEKPRGRVKCNWETDTQQQNHGRVEIGILRERNRTCGWRGERSRGINSMWLLWVDFDLEYWLRFWLKRPNACAQRFSGVSSLRLTLVREWENLWLPEYRVVRLCIRIWVRVPRCSHFKYEQTR